jgi:hypothetical protein
VSGFLAGLAVDLGNGDLCPFAGKQDRGGARPMPLPAPVMKATLPASLAIDLSLSTANREIA